MNARGTNKVFLLNFILFVLFFSFLFFTPIAQALIQVEIKVDALNYPAGDPINVESSCKICDGSCVDCGDDFTWEWSVFPPDNKPDASYELLLPDTSSPIFIPYAPGIWDILYWDILAKVCNDYECGTSNRLTIVTWNPNHKFPLSYKRPFVIYESTAFPLNVECALDEDGNGLSDLAEKQIAQSFAPMFAFDNGEECWSLSPTEPWTVYNIAMDAVEETAEGHRFHLKIRYGMVWQYDGGFQSSNVCVGPFRDYHVGDTQGLTVTAWLQKDGRKAHWIAELESISGFVETDGRPFYVHSPPPGHGWMTRFPDNPTHPVVYPTEGKHHFRPEAGVYHYDDGFVGCTENAWGNRFPWRIPQVEHVPHFFSNPSTFAGSIGPQGGPPTMDFVDHIEWANVCWLIKGIPDQKATSFRNVDIGDWTYRHCPIDPDDSVEEFCCNLPLIPYHSGPEGGPLIIHDKFLGPEANGIWSLVQFGFNIDIDGDGDPNWLDPCPVSEDYTDSDSDGICDPLDVCPFDAEDDGDGDGICDVLVPNQPPFARCVDVTVDADESCLGSASINNGSYDPDGDPITLIQTPSGPYGLGETAVTLTVTDDKGASNVCEAIVKVLDQEAPIITCPVFLEDECTGPNGTPIAFDVTAKDNCAEDLTISCDHSSGSIFFLGSTPVLCTAMDNSGNLSSCEFTVTVGDTTPPVIFSVSASPNVLWPSNHKMIPISVAVDASDTCDPEPVCQITLVESNEPENGVADGDTAPDWEITGDFTVKLRAERSGKGNGRVYTNTVECTDDGGNSSTEDVIVTVPKSNKKK